MRLLLTLALLLLPASLASADPGDTVLVKSNGTVNDSQGKESNVLITGIGDRTLVKTDQSVVTFERAFQIGIETVNGKPLKVGQVKCTGNLTTIDYFSIAYENKAVDGIKDPVPLVSMITPIASYKLPQSSQKCLKLAARASNGTDPMVLLIDIGKGAVIRTLQRP